MLLEAELGPPFAGRKGGAEQRSGIPLQHTVRSLVRKQLQVRNTKGVASKSYVKLMLCDPDEECQIAIVMGISINNGAASNAQQAKE